MTPLVLDQVAVDLKDLPSLPAIVMDLLNALERDDLKLEILSKKINQDPALTAKTLRYANSPFYGTQVKVTTIQQAIGLMGLDAVKQMALAAGLSGCFPRNDCYGFDHKAFWRHANAVAYTAKLIARRVELNEDVAFTAGLLHDIGVLGLVTLYPYRYEQVIDYQSQSLITQREAEERILGVDHTQVGASLARAWNFSETMRNAIIGHHHPDQHGSGILATIVHIADGIAHMLGISTIPRRQMISVSVTSWSSLNLDPASLDTLIEEATIKFKKLDQADL